MHRCSDPHMFILSLSVYALLHSPCGKHPPHPHIDFVRAMSSATHDSGAIIVVTNHLQVLSM